MPDVLLDIAKSKDGEWGVKIVSRNICTVFTYDGL